MQISTFTDYSIRVLIYLATLPKGELTQISHVSHLYNISRNHLVKVIHKLSQLGYIETIQGKNGGFRLNMSPENIHIGDVFRHLEPLQLLNCDLAFCHISPACRLKGYLIDAKEAFLQELDQYTIQDLLTNNTEIVDLLEHSN
ncbi:nitric oxide-sensing transcriptional repressor NsrR [Neisseria sp. Ec49-e6-T10]|uniref:nitric oxide-sensing transcriptional repressor NsrR n=1 Tax=Neisseria sp. Ec49-e6-T10 TaxID=3140744 RepID=UPI003EBE35CD